MVTFKLGAIVGGGGEIDVGESGLTIRGPAHDNILQVIEVDRRILPVCQPAIFRVSLTLSHDEKIALAAALRQAARNQQRNS